MKRRIILAIAALAVIFGSSAAVVEFRVQHLPSLLTIFVSLSYLSRVRDQSYAGQALVSMKLTTTNDTSDNVTLTSAVGFDNLTSKAYWRLQIVLNESAVTVPPWEHDIAPVNDTAGQYGGTVSKSFDAKGVFSMWIILWSVYDGKSAVLWSTSELVRVYDAWF